MSNAALTNLWNYIQGMALSDRNKQWLADRLIESKTKAEKNELDLAMEDIREGRVISYNSLDDLIKDI